MADVRGGRPALRETGRGETAPAAANDRDRRPELRRRSPPTAGQARPARDFPIGLPRFKKLIFDVKYDYTGGRAGNVGWRQPGSSPCGAGGFRTQSGWVRLIGRTDASAPPSEPTGLVAGLRPGVPGEEKAGEPNRWASDSPGSTGGPMNGAGVTRELRRAADTTLSGRGDALRPRRWSLYDLFEAHS